MPQSAVTTIILFSALLLIMLFITAYSTTMITSVRSEGIRKSLTVICASIYAQILRAESLASTLGGNVTLEINYPKLLGSTTYVIYFINASNIGKYLNYVNLESGESAVILKLGNVWVGQPLPQGTYLTIPEIIVTSYSKVLINVTYTNEYYLISITPVGG